MAQPCVETSAAATEGLLVSSSTQLCAISQAASFQLPPAALNVFFLGPFEEEQLFGDTPSNAALGMLL